MSIFPLNTSDAQIHFGTFYESLCRVLTYIPDVLHFLSFAQSAILMLLGM